MVPAVKPAMLASVNRIVSKGSLPISEQQLAAYGLGGGSVIGAGARRSATLPRPTGGVGCAVPPGASFSGVRSLSLVLSDFGSLWFFLLLIFCSLFSCFVSSLVPGH